MNKVKESLVNSLSELQSPQCQYFVVRKKRLCRMTVRPGRQYCGEHEPQPKNEDGLVDTRVPCPNDPKHTCYISKLQKHLSICNARQGELPPYIVKGINTAMEPEDSPRPLLSEVPRDMMEQLIEKVNKLYDLYVKDEISLVADQSIHPMVLSDYEQSDRTESSRRHLQQASSLLGLAEAAGLVADRTCYVELGAGKGHMSYYAWRAWCEPTTRASSVLLVDRASLRHKRDNKLRDIAYTTARNQAQNASNEDTASPSPEGPDQNFLTDTLNEIPRTLQSSDDDTVSPTPESPDQKDSITDTWNHIPRRFSAETVNRTSHIPRTTRETTNGISQDLNHTSSMSDAKKTDLLDAESYSEVSNMDAPVRLRADLADLVLDKVPVVQECERVVGFAKHLCGVATDFALRCVTAASLRHKTRGLVVATCCHHRCQLGTYVGTKYLLELGISARELQVLFSVASWATCGDGRSRTRRDKPQPTDDALPTSDPSEAFKLPLEARSEAGRRTKALLDWARARWLRARGLRARLRRFVPRAASPENVAIVATL